MYKTTWSRVGSDVNSETTVFGRSILFRWTGAHLELSPEYRPFADITHYCQYSLLSMNLGKVMPRKEKWLYDNELVDSGNCHGQLYRIMINVHVDNNQPAGTR